MVETLSPRDDKDLAEIILGAAGTDRVFQISGGNTKTSVGGPVAEGRECVRLDTSALSGILDYDPADLVITARAATPLADLVEELKKHNQMLAFEPPDYAEFLTDERAVPTIAGTIAVNASGPRRLGAGAARDHLLGFTAVSGQGEIFKSGGRVVKNVTGFDLSKVMAGSWGTLAVLTEVTLKTVPIPADEVTVIIWGQTIDQACRTMARAFVAPLSLSSAAYLPDPVANKSSLRNARAATLLRLEGVRASIDARCASLINLIGDAQNSDILSYNDSRGIWSAIGAVGSILPPDKPVCRIALNRAQALDYLQQVESHDWYADWAGGLIWLAGDTPPPTVPGDGHVQQWRSPERGRPCGRPDISASVLQPMLDVKRAFDPQDRLNPGRLLAPLSDAAEWDW